MGQREGVEQEVEYRERGLRSGRDKWGLAIHVRILNFIISTIGNYLSI